MGWGTFIAGQAIGSVRRAGRRHKASDYTQTADFLNNIINKRINVKSGMSGIQLETEVLREIKRLKSEGKDGDIDVLREVVQNRFKTYHRLGPKLELEIIQKAQQKALAGEEVNYAQIEREILDTLNTPKKLTEQEEIELQKLKYEKQEQKKLLRDREAQERRVTRKNLRAKELEPEQLDKDRDNLSWRQQNYLASKKGQAQRESLAFKILLVLTIVFGGFLLYGVVMVFLA